MNNLPCKRCGTDQRSTLQGGYCLPCVMRILAEWEERQDAPIEYEIPATRAEGLASQHHP
jgi:hypothetical protein